MPKFTSSGVVLEKVCEYLYFNEKSKEEKDVPDMEIPPELCLELLMAADFFQSELCCRDLVPAMNFGKKRENKIGRVPNQKFVLDNELLTRILAV